MNTLTVYIKCYIFYTSQICYKKRAFPNPLISLAKKEPFQRVQPVSWASNPVCLIICKHHCFLIFFFFSVLGIMYSFLSGGWSVRLTPFPNPYPTQGTPSQLLIFLTDNSGQRHLQCLLLLLLCKHYSGPRHVANFAYFFFPAHFWGCFS